MDLAEAALENGAVIYTDADDFAEGEEAYIINDEGERIPSLLEVRWPTAENLHRRCWQNQWTWRSRWWRR